MAAAFFFSTEVGIQAALHRGEGLEVTAEGEAVGVVMSPCVFRDMLAPGLDAAYAGHLQRCHRHPDAAAADDDRHYVRITGGQGRAGELGELRVVGAVGARAAVVGAGVALFRQVVDDGSLELVSAVVAAEVDFHAFLPTVANTNRLARNNTIKTRINRLYAGLVRARPRS